MKTLFGAASLMGMMLALTPAMANEAVTEEPLVTSSMTPVDIDENPSLPFQANASLFKVSLYDAVSLERLISSGLIGSRHNLKALLREPYVRIEVPGYRIRLDTLLGYDPEVDEVRPYQTEFDPNVRYRLDRGAFRVSGDGFSQCGDVRAIYSSGSSLYFDMPEDGEGAQCAIDVLLKSYQMFAFHKKDRPEVYEVRKLEDNQEKMIYEEKIPTSEW